ncbi:MAG: sulfatase [Saprospiraceae bacterium]|nr:sulfatase [Saprospiraceae bacterium]
MRQINYFCFLLMIGLLSFSCTQGAKQEVGQSEEDDNYSLPEKPNILWLVAEDLSPYVPSFGDSTVQTPNLSRLAAEGICYDHVYAPAPVCAPARAAIATGMYPNHIGAGHMRTGPWFTSGLPQSVYDNAIKRAHPKGVPAYEAVPPPEVKMMSEYLRMHGYYCSNNAKEDYQFFKPVTAWDECSNEAHWRNRKDNQPFFSIFNFGVTHESRIWVKAEDSLWIPEDAPIIVPPYLPDNEVGRRDVRRMYSNVVELDQQIGEVLSELEEDGLLESTIIFFYSDHGGPLPRQKRLLYDSGLRVPMIIRLPQQHAAGSRSDQLISFIDFAPTVLSLAGIQPPSHMDGRAFMGAFSDPQERKYIHAAADRFDEVYDRNRAVKDHRYKYIRYFYPDKPMYLPVSYREQMPVMQELLKLRDANQLNPEQALWFRDRKPPVELFDTETDPHELNNLADDPSLAGKLEELSDECDRWIEEIEDKGLLDEKDLIAEIWPDSFHPVTADPEIHNEEAEITITCSTPGASIGFKMWTEEEPSAWQVYTGPFNLIAGANLKVVAHRIGYKPSTEVEGIP